MELVLMYSFCALSLIISFLSLALCVTLYIKYQVFMNSTQQIPVAKPSPIGMDDLAEEIFKGATNDFGVPPQAFDRMRKDKDEEEEEREFKKQFPKGLAPDDLV